MRARQAARSTDVDDGIDPAMVYSPRVVESLLPRSSLRVHEHVSEIVRVAVADSADRLREVTIERDKLLVELARERDRGTKLGNERDSMQTQLTTSRATMERVRLAHACARCNSHGAGTRTGCCGARPHQARPCRKDCGERTARRASAEYVRAAARTGGS